MADDPPAGDPSESDAAAGAGDAPGDADAPADEDDHPAESDADARPHVLVAYDGTPQSEVALEYACKHHTDARLTVLYAIDPVAAGYGAEVSLPSAAEEWYESAKARAENLLSDAAATAAEGGLTVETVSEVGRPASAVVEYAESNDVDHVVIGSHGRTGVSRILVGSVAEKVVRGAPVTVTVAR